MATDHSSAPVLHPFQPTRLLEDFQCLKCNHLYLKNQCFQTIQEDIGGEHSKFRIAVHRWYLPCATCSSQIIFRTNLITHAFQVEYGAIPIDSFGVNPRQRKSVGPVPEGVVDPEKFLKKFEDSIPSMMIVRALECTLDFIKRSESVGNVSDQEIYMKGALNIQNGMFPNKCPHFVIRTDDHIFMSPFVKLLTKVTWNHLPNFLKELRDFLTTDKWNGIVFASGEPNKRGNDKVAIPPALRAAETVQSFLDAINKYSVRNTKAPLSTAVEHHPSVLVPFNMKCTKCSHIIRKGEQFPMLEEFFGEDSPVIQMRLIRYYMECPKCAASLVFRSDFLHKRYIKEYGVVPVVPPKTAEVPKTEGEEARGSGEPVDPMFLLTQFPKITEHKKKVIDDLENALYEFRSEMENSIVDVWAPKIKKEMEEDKRLDETAQKAFIEKKSIRPFADTMGMVPEFHCKRFYVALLHQTATEQFLAKTTNYFEPFMTIATSEAFLDVLKQWWKKIHYSNLLAPKLTMVPFGMKCKKCSNCVYKGKKLEMTQEILGDGSPLLRMTLHRFYMNCPHCSSAMIFRSNFQQNRYIKEFGIELLPEDSKVLENDRPKEKYCNPMRLLKQQRPLTDSEKKLVDDIEENIDQINRSDESAKLKMFRMIRCEIDKQLQAKYLPEPLRIRDWATNPFSDTVQLVPEYHTSRFIQAIINQLVTPEFLRVAKKKTIAVRDTYLRQIDEFDGVHSTVTPPSPTILPIHLKCKRCTKMMFIGHILEMKCETIQGVLGIPIKIYRYYFDCPYCKSNIIIRSALSDQDFRVEFGAEKVVKPKGKWNQGIPHGIMDPRDDIKRFAKDEKEWLKNLDDFENSVTKLFFEDEYSPEVQSHMARMEAESVTGYIGTRHKVVSEEAMKKLLTQHCPYALSVRFIPETAIYHAIMTAKKQLMTHQFCLVIFNQ